MATNTRREFTEEFKDEAIGLLESGGRPLMHVAKELGIQSSMLRNWRGRLGSGAGQAAVSEQSAKTVTAMPAKRPKLAGCRRNSGGGIVTLLGQEARWTEGQSLASLKLPVGRTSPLPDPEGVVTSTAVPVCCHQVPPRTEVIVDHAVCREEPLCLLA